MRKLALVVGIETYRDAGITPLRFAVHDATALAEALSDECGFDSVRTLAGEEGPDEPTAANILTALDSLTKDADDGDLLLFFFAGHGIERDEHTWLLTRDAYSGNPRVGSLPLADLREALPQHVGARILLIDACRNSPYAARGDLPNTLTNVVARDIKAAAKRSTTLHGTTAVLFACATGQRAYEWPDKKHGVFTHYLLEGLQNPPPAPPWTRTGLTIQRLAQHVTERVSRWSQRTPNLPHPQQPWYFQEGQPTDIQLATYVGAAELTPSNTAIGTGPTGSAAPPLATPGRDPTPSATLVALKKAITANDLGAVQEALSSGIDVNARYTDGTAPLHHAAKRARDPAIIEALMHAGADVNGKTADGITPLEIAAISNPHPNIHRSLVQLGAILEPEGITPLMSAAAFNNADVVRALTELNADHDARDRRGETPLMRAAETTAHPAVIKALLEAGADVNATSDDGTTALSCAFRNAPDERIEVIKALLGGGAYPHALVDPATGRTAAQSALDRPAHTPLHRAFAAFTAGAMLQWTWARALGSFVIVLITGLVLAPLVYVLAPTQLPAGIVGHLIVYVPVTIGGMITTLVVIGWSTAGAIEYVTKARVLTGPHVWLDRYFLLPVGWVILSVGAAFVPLRFDLALAVGMVVLAAVHGMAYVVFPPVPYAARSPKPATPRKPKRRAKRRSRPASLSRRRPATAPRPLGHVIMGFRWVRIVFPTVAIVGISLVVFGQYPQLGRDALGQSLDFLQRSASWFRELPSSVTRMIAEPLSRSPVARSPSPLAVGEASSLIVDPAGRVWATGSNWVGNLGDGTSTSRSVFTQALFPSDIRIEHVTADGGHVLALDQYGHAWAWGENESGALGDGTRINRSQPVRVQMPSETTFVAVEAGPGFSLALDDAGIAWGWGTNLAGQLGDGTLVDRYRPTRIDMPANTRFTALAAGQAHVVALDANGHAWEWGQAIVSDGAVNRLTPVRVPTRSDLRFTAVAAGDRVSFGIDPDGQAWSWGSPGWMMLGTGGWGPLAAPTRVGSPPGVRFVAIAPGAQSVIAIDQHGQAWEWGAVISAMASGTREDLVGSPAAITMPANVRFAHVRNARGWDAHHALAVDRDGRVWAWGSNEVGQLGTDDPAFRDRAASPILVASSFDARVESAEPRPPNDDFGQATPIFRTEGVTSSHNRRATNEPAEPDHAEQQGQASVWYAWRSPWAQPALIVFSTAGSTFDTLLYAYKSSLPDQPHLRDLTLVASSDDVEGTYQSRITFEAAPNTTYYVAVAGYEGATGEFTLTWGDATHVWGEGDFGNAIATGLELRCDNRRAYASSFDGGPYPMERCPPSERLAFSRTDDPVGWDLSAPWFTYFGSYQLLGVRAYFVSWTISELRGTGGFNNLNVYLQPDGGTPYLAYTIESQTPDSEVYDPRYPDRILASVRDYAPGDANCCPSASTQQVFRATDTRLELVDRRTVSHVQPSFDCAQAASWSEHAICASSELARLDVAMSDAFAQARDSLAEETFEAIRLEQRAWLQAREECQSPSDRQERIECLARMTRDRTSSLLSLVDAR